MSETTLKVFLVTVISMVVLAGYLFLRVNSLKDGYTTSSTLGTKVSSDDGKQIIELRAKAGYFPASVKALANKDTILRVITDSTFDCSAALTIPKLGIRKNLPPTDTTDISLGSQSPGTKLVGTCAMGMYRFDLSFN